MWSDFKKIGLFCVVPVIVMWPVVNHHFWPTRHVSQEGFEKIEIGMTQDEAIRLLGAPPGDYATKDVSTKSTRDMCFCVHESNVLLVWKTDNFFVTVTIDQNRKVESKCLTLAYENIPPEPVWPWSLWPWRRKVEVIEGTIMK